MAATPQEIRAGLAANLATLPFQVTEYAKANPTPPTAQFMPGDIDYDRAMRRGLDVWTWIVQAFVGTAVDEGAQMLLDDLLQPAGATSMKTQIESDRKLGGKVDDLHVTRCGRPRFFTRADGTAVYGAEWEVDIYAGN